MSETHKHCRYCKREGTSARGGDLVREGPCGPGAPLYACRDLEACGERLREQRRAAGIPDTDPSVPF